MADERRGETAGPGGVLGIRVRPDLDEALTAQIALQVVGAIRAGGYPPGRRLPSVRRMAAALGVHRETVRGAYRRLRGDGWVRVERGSGAYVHPHVAPAGVGEGSPLRAVLARARSEGATAEGTARALERWAGALRRRSALVVGPDRATAAVWAAELRADLAGLGVTVRHGRLPDIGWDPDDPPSLVLAAPPEVGRLARRTPEGTELFGLRPGPGPRLRRWFRRLPRGAVVGVLSASARIRDEVTRIAAAERGGEVAVVAPPPRLPDRDEELSVARFVLVDEEVAALGASLAGGRELRRFRHLDRATARTLAAWLGRPREPSSSRPPSARSRPTSASPEPPRGSP